MLTSGLILDVYDDVNGDILRSAFPSRDSIPGMVKTAHALTSEERGLLPDDVFALVLINGEETLRKYACTDEGNTYLSMMYFLENAHKLPDEAQKVAAANLQIAGKWYGLECQELEKFAFMGMIGAAARQAAQHPFTAFQTAMVAPEVAHTASMNNRIVSSINADEGGGGRVITPEEIQKHKLGEVGSAMPISASTTDKPDQTKATIQKTGAHLVAHHPKGEKGVDPDDNINMMHKEQPKGAPQAHTMSPHVDVTTKEAHGPVTIKKASRYALGDKYPLDSYEQVKQAHEYFHEFGNRMSPVDRREYCANLLPRAEELNIKVAEDVRHYGGDDFGTDDQIKIAHDLRANVLTSMKQLDVLNALFEKRAELGAELFVETLAEFDKLSGLDLLYDKDIPDPYFSVLYKQAEEEYSYVDGNNTITEMELRALGHVGSRAVKTTFGEDFMVEFQKDPVGIFKSLPKDQKHMIMNMANDNSAPGVALRA